MKAWVRFKRKFETEYLGTVLSVLMLAVIIFFGMSPTIQSVALAGDPLEVNFRTIDAVEQADSPGTTVWTLELVVTNNDAVAYSNVTVTAVSLMDSNVTYGSALVGNVSQGGVQTVNVKFLIPDQDFGNVKFRIDHS